MSDDNLTTRLRLEGLRSYVSGLREARKATEEYGEESERVQQKVAGSSSGLSGALGGVAGIAGKAALAMGAVAATGVAMGGALGLKTAANLETAEIAFTTMLGSAAKAKAFIADLSDFAAKTPFDFPGLQEGASQLIAAGIATRDVIPMMTTLGNVTAGMGTGAEGIQRATTALQQMTAAQKISAEDLNQLRDAGIPVYDLLSRALGKSKAEIAGMVQGGKLGKEALDKMMGALRTGNGLERFNGLMEKQATSLSGLWSTFKDNLGMGLAKAIQPLLPELKSLLGWAGEKLPPALNALASGLSGLIQWFRKGTGETGSLRKAWDVLSRILTPLVGWVKGSLIPTFERVGGSVMSSLRGSVKSLSEAFRDHQGLIDKVGRVFKVLGLIATDVVIPVLGEAVKLVGFVLTPVFRVLATVLETVVFPAFKYTLKFLLGILGAIVTGAAKAFGWVPGLGPKLQGAAEEFKRFRDSVNGALDGISDKKINVRVSLAGQGAGVLTDRAAAERAAAQSVFTRRAAGGLVRGPGTGTSDSIVARVSNGEYVVPASTVKSVGTAFLDSLPGYARGGFVSQVSTVRRPEPTRRLTLNADDGGRIVEVHTHVHLDGREVATSVQQHRDTRRARL